MGGKSSKNKHNQQELADAAARSKVLERELERENEHDDVVQKLLLLGAGESGKSTLFKQMITIYGTGFPLEERKNYTEFVRRNTLNSIKTLVENCPNFTPVTPENEPHCEIIREIKEEDDKIAPEVVAAIMVLWRDPGVLATHEKRSQFQLMDSAQYFLDRIEIIAGPNYVPSEQDVLRTRVRTIGIVENNFEIEGVQYKMFDVGGQRSERKKWLHCFESVTAVLFVAAMSEFDQNCFEDNETNRVHEALTLFEEICNNQWFKNTAMILFLNKKDLLQSKLDRGVQVRDFFPDFCADNNNLDYVAAFFKDKFVALNRRLGKKIYCHVTCATDRGNVAAVFNAVKDIILNKQLTGAGLA
jgi:GTPase SAR1 family protein